MGLFFLQFILGASLASAVMCWADRSDNPSWWNQRSACASCEHPLTYLDLIPVVSGCLLRARCRYCQAPYGWVYPLAEFGMGWFFVIEAGQPLVLATALTLLALSIEDYRTLSAHVLLVIPLIACSFIWPITVISWPLVAFNLALSMWLIIAKKTLGSGDGPILVLLAGQLSPLTWSLALLIACSSALICYALGQRRHIPFIPFLSLGWLVAICLIR
ncbi:prepilin peptidase [Lactobacillaceae bacterium L1_55_11]|nr:prepilin peptidase [Lactobacillaceae bacterium L1_55_11]